jgi:hypothetical protein
LPNYHIAHIKDRPTSPSVKQLVRQYYHNRDKEKRQKEKTILMNGLPFLNEEKNKFSDNNESNNQKTTQLNDLNINNYEEEMFEIASRSSKNSLSKAKSVCNSFSSRSSSNPVSSNEISLKFNFIKNEQFYSKTLQRPRTVPHEIFHDDSILKEQDQNNKNIKIESVRSSVVGFSRIKTPDSNINENEKKSEKEEVMSAINFEDEVNVEWEIKSNRTAKTAESSLTENKNETLGIDKSELNEENQSLKREKLGEENLVKDDLESNSSKSVEEDSPRRLDVKANSDIFPLNKKNCLINLQNDYILDMKQLNETQDFKLSYAIELETVKKNECDKEKEAQNKRRQEAARRFNLVPQCSKGVQVTQYELNRYYRKVMMDDRAMAKRLDYSELLAERLVTSALLAGSDENITVNCVLLPGSGFIFN